MGLLAFAAGCDSGPCGEDANRLAGSVSELYDLRVDDVRARRIEADVVTIEYFHGENIVAKVVAGVRGFRVGAAFPLRDGSVYRVTSPPTDFPDRVEAGAITFESGLNEGETVSGCFNARFLMDDGSQRTIRGAFETKLEAGF
ncbi:hypothetical protein [Vulgatibacter incomptus]|uniref:Lipoprotein n=1 Tax=Vulgatibacter incomptus TaxID=1391653 RepID=A0A0K1PF25_9BACT|nr:hypothetical protein [Vulgatibacter incomptus]AKU92112.1 hypothetical protein AKJ08_2499 [Vulgatibacter incomptus]